MAVIKRNGNSMGLPMNINRGNPIPLDTTAVWYSLSEAQTYATSGATAYVGQIITVVDEKNATSTCYIIANSTGLLVQLSSSASTAALTGKLTIGSQVYDGTADVTIDIYDGAYS